LLIPTPHLCWIGDWTSVQSGPPSCAI
jgi:hypothetical protein